ncbi:MAG: DUF721 domain-containing protein [Gammaproteobacteria bacterium]|jgi:hypothetical protein
MKPIKELLPPHLRHRIETLSLLDFTLHAYLGRTLAAHCRILSIQESQLILGADSAAWATQLRYQQHEILKVLNSEHSLGLRKLRVRVLPAQISDAAARTQPKRRPPLSARSAELITACAAEQDDPDLKAALLRLASRAHGPGR